jgi:hypothetical protein
VANDPGNQGSQIIRCPLCPWQHDATPPDVSSGALASVFGYGVMSAIAFNEHLQKTEKALLDHLGSHSIVEWVRQVSELEAELTRLREASRG